MSETEKNYFSNLKIADVHLHSPNVVFSENIEMVRDIKLIGEPHHLRCDRNYTDALIGNNDFEYKRLLKSDVLIKTQCDPDWPVKLFDRQTLFAFTLGLSFPQSRLTFGLSSFGVIGNPPHSWGPQISIFAGNTNDSAWITMENERDIINLYESLLSRLWIEDYTMDHYIAGLALHSTLEFANHRHNGHFFIKSSLNHIFPIEFQKITSAYTLLEALLNPKNGKDKWQKAVNKWNETHTIEVSENHILYIKYSRDTFVHFNPDFAERQLKEIRENLGFKKNDSAEYQFVQSGIPVLLKEIVKDYFCSEK